MGFAIDEKIPKELPRLESVIQAKYEVKKGFSMEKKRESKEGEGKRKEKKGKQ